MNFMWILSTLIVISVAAEEAVDLYQAGIGHCFLCTQKADIRGCCSGNKLCEAIDGELACIQDEPVHNDIQRAHPEFLEQQQFRASSSTFCTICCGIDSQSTTCCSGRTYCGCTKAMYPSCVE